MNFLKENYLLGHLIKSKLDKSCFPESIMKLIQHYINKGILINNELCLFKR